MAQINDQLTLEGVTAAVSKLFRGLPLPIFVAKRVIHGGGGREALYALPMYSSSPFYGVLRPLEIVRSALRTQGLKIPKPESHFQYAIGDDGGNNFWGMRLDLKSADLPKVSAAIADAEKIMNHEIGLITQIHGILKRQGLHGLKQATDGLYLQYDIPAGREYKNCFDRLEQQGFTIKNLYNEVAVISFPNPAGLIKLLSPDPQPPTPGGN